MWGSAAWMLLMSHIPRSIPLGVHLPWGASLSGCISPWPWPSHSLGAPGGPAGGGGPSPRSLWAFGDELPVKGFVFLAQRVQTR